jgi:uncharacterized protein YcfJ
MAGYGVGASLQSLGMQQRSEATQMLAKSASNESERNQKNQVMKAQAKAGNQQLGATAGAMAGSMFGPWGTVIGGAVGAIAGGFMD